MASLSPGSGVAATATWNPGLDYSYDGSGNVTQVVSDVYTYDAFNRPASSTVAGVTRSYTYDAYGNRTGCTENGVTCGKAGAAEASTNRMTSLEYDTDGNVICDTDDCAGPHHAYRYDALNMQTKETYGTNKREYVYTADDERIAVYSNDSTWKWSIRGLDNKVLREFTSSDHSNGSLGTENWTWTKDYVWRDGLLLATRQPVPGSTTGATTTYSYHLDHLGATTSEPRA